MVKLIRLAFTAFQMVKMDIEKCESRSDNQLNFEEAQKKETKIEDKSINVTWKPKHKVKR